MTSILSTQQSFLRAILENPFDNTVRLAYADYLDDNNIEPARSELIRVQIELESKPKRYKIEHRETLRGFGKDYYEVMMGNPGNGNALDQEVGEFKVGDRLDIINPMRIKKKNPTKKYGLLVNKIIPDDEDMVRVILKKDELSVKDNRYWWLVKREGQLMGKWDHFITPSIGDMHLFSTDNIKGHYNNVTNSTFRRGFVDEVSLSSIQFTEDYAKKLFSEQPITKVVLNDKTPMHGIGDNERRWYEDRGLISDVLMWQIPSSIWYKINTIASIDLNIYKKYISKEYALEALSRGCVRYGRELAGLTDIYGDGI